MGLHTGQGPVLLCPDILMEIFSHLQPGRRTQKEKTVTRKQRRVCRRALLNSALTCRTLSDLALDVLWRALDDIRPLLRLLLPHKRPLVSDFFLFTVASSISNRMSIHRSSSRTSRRTRGRSFKATPLGSARLDFSRIQSGCIHQYGPFSQSSARVRLYCHIYTTWTPMISL